MVQQPPGGPPSQPVTYFSQKDSNWPRNESHAFVDPSSAPERLPHIPPLQRHPEQPTTVDTALKNYAGIPNIKRWALIIQTEEPEPRAFTSQDLKPYRDHFFSDQFKHAFMSSVLRADGQEVHHHPAYNQDNGMYSEFDSDLRKLSSESELARPQQEKSRSDGSVGAKRRRKGCGGTFRPKPDPNAVAQSTQKHDLTIGDDDQVEAFFLVRFKDMQQSACKIIGKAFVKLVEPKKQTHHPYTGGDGKAPPWWPNTTGENCVRHREPDHLLRHERIRLLVHILKMIVEPVEKQCPTVQKLELSVRTLEAFTMEAMSNWFADKEHPDNEQKRPFLREIFKVARLQERYKNGLVDAETVTSVRYGDRIGREDESDGDSERYGKLEHDDQAIISNNSLHMPSPPDSLSLVSPSLAQNQQHFQPADENGMREMRLGLPMRYSSMEQQMAYEDQSFRNMGQFQAHQAQSPPSTMDPSRRNYNPSFQAPQLAAPQSVFASGWSSHPVTSAPVSQFYTTSPHASLPPFGPFHLPQPQQTSHMHQTAHQFHDGLARYDTGPAIGNQLRTGSLGHPHHQMPSPAVFQDYMGPENTPFSQHPEMKNDQPHHLQPN